MNWPIQTGTSGNLSNDPLFANAAAGDFRREVARGAAGIPRPRPGSWTRFAAPASTTETGLRLFALEPAPNGGRINMGADGNTPYALQVSSGGGWWGTASRRPPLAPVVPPEEVDEEVPTLRRGGVILSRQVRTCQPAAAARPQRAARSSQPMRA